MPIRPELKPRYPPNWASEIRPAILERARNCCERCGVPDRVVGYRTAGGTFVQLGTSWDAAGCRVDAATEDGHRVIEIVLTIAHLDQIPEHNDPENLAALCQQCHNRHDAPYRTVNRWHTRRSKRAAGDLFPETLAPRVP